MKHLGEKRKKSDIKFLYIDDRGHGRLLRHKLSQYKKKLLEWIYVKKLYRLRLKTVSVEKIPIIVAEEPKFEIRIQPFYVISPNDEKKTRIM